MNRNKRIIFLSVLLLIIFSFLFATITNASPSKKDIDKAKKDQLTAQLSVDQIEKRINTLSEKIENAIKAAGIATEQYNINKVKVEEIKKEIKKSEKQIVKTQNLLSSTKSVLARAVMNIATSNSGIKNIEPFLTKDGLDKALEEVEFNMLLGSASKRASNTYDSLKKELQIQQNAQKVKSDQLTNQQIELKKSAEKARLEAENTQKQMVSVDEERNRLISILAAKKNTTKALVNQYIAAKEAKKRGSGSAGSNPPSGGNNTVSSASAAQNALSWGKKQIGKPYIWGGTGPDGFDCSGLTQQSWLKGAGVYIPRVAEDQYYASVKVSYSNMRPGDLIFYGTGYIYHVTMYAGNNMMLEAPYTGQNVKLTPIRWSNTLPYAGRF